MRRGLIIAIVAAVALAIGMVVGARWLIDRAESGPTPETVAAASLQGLREQNRLSAFTARYVAVVTSTQNRLGGMLSARRTLVMPGTVRYEIDLARLGERDVRWDEASRTLEVTLPPVDLVGPQVDLGQIQEYDAGGLLLRLTDVEQRLDAANRRAGQAELLKQARGPVPMRLARDAHRRAVEQSFALPLRAAGLDARVRARFADEARPSDEQMDRSRSLEEVFGNAG